MRIQCEECGKNYQFDDSKMKTDRIVLKCKTCENPIEVVNPRKKNISLPARSITAADFGATLFDTRKTGRGTDLTASAESQTYLVTGQDSKINERGAAGLTISKRLLLLFASFIIVMGGILTFVYMKYVPALMHDQINLRTFSISASLSAAIQQPLLIKNYLSVNKMAEANTKLPGVAYVTVINNKGMVVAGIIGDQARFAPDFVQEVENGGFTKKIATLNRIPAGKTESALDLSMGGQKIHDVAVSIGETGGESHVGLFVEDVDREVRKSLTPLLVLLAAIALIGGLSFFLVSRTISTPIRTLTQAAERISLGEIDLPIEVNTKGEIGELAASLERMRSSIKVAMSRLQQRGR
jgi:predicted Zn finger-like uncharacterized protein